MFNAEDIGKMNADIEQWNINNTADLLSEMDALNIKHSKFSPNKIPLRRALKSAFGKKFELIDRISYKMPRSAVFLHKGVSRSHGENNPREAKEWFNPIVDKNIDSLGDIVADGQGTMIINAINIK